MTSRIVINFKLESLLNILLVCDIDEMDPKFIEIAKDELREDDLRKQQALAQFNEFLDKHPFLVKVRRGKVRISEKIYIYVKLRNFEFYR